MHALKALAFTAVLILISLPLTAATKCEDLAGMKLADTTITSAQVVAAGAFVAPETPFNGDETISRGYKDLPAFCRVTATIKPSKDSDIRIEVWMPVSGWTGRYEGVGNGGFAGSIIYPAMAGALRQGSAAAATDTGHQAAVIDATWALGHPEKITDFGYRAIHEMTLKAKALVKAFYGDAPRHSYFASCSNGGRQGLMEAQRFPEDYDGIIAGAPAYAWTHLLSGAVFDGQATLNDPASYIPAKKVPAISAAVLAACDAKDGVKDGLVSDPPHCGFDPMTMVCKQGEPPDSSNCLTEAQATALKKIYAGPRTSNGKQVRPGFSPGGEEGPGGWGLWILGPGPGRALLFAFGNGFFKNMVFNDPNWDLKSAKLDEVVKAADEKQARNLNATDPNLKAFKARGGKLILYHGWSDPAIPAQGTIDYFNQIKDAQSFARLYLAPGMQHCIGGPGFSAFGQFERSSMRDDPQRNVYAAMEQWVEKGIAPDKLIATKVVEGEFKGSRPLCPYPQVGKYKGSGEVDEAANWSCSK
jgi:tannase/feruloyl esterase